MGASAFEKLDVAGMKSRSLWLAIGSVLAPLILVGFLGMIVAMFSGKVALVVVGVWWALLILPAYSNQGSVRQAALRATEMVDRATVGDIDFGLASVVKAGRQWTPAGFAVRKSTGTLFVWKGSIIKEYARKEVRGAQAPHWVAPMLRGIERITAIHVGGGTFQVRSSLGLDALGNYHADVQSRIRDNNIWIATADIDHPEWLIWCPPLSRQRYAEMLDQLLKLNQPENNSAK